MGFLARRDDFESINAAFRFTRPFAYGKTNLFDDFRILGIIPSGPVNLETRLSYTRNRIRTDEDVWAQTFILGSGTGYDFWREVFLLCLTWRSPVRSPQTAYLPFCKKISRRRS